MLLLAAKAASGAAPGAPRRAIAAPTADRLEWPRRGLSARTRRIVRAATEAMFADESAAGALLPASEAMCDRAVSAFDRAIGQSSADLRRGFAVLGLLLEWLPLFVIGAPSRMSRLPLERRLAYFEALEASRIGLFAMLLVAFKVPLAIPAFEEAEELALTGFDRPDTVARRRLVRPRAPSPETEAGA
jgi:hypothetical protein